LSEDRSVSYRELAARFSLAETSVTNELSAARQQFRQIVLDTLREATASEQEFRAEARALLGIDA
jgi:F0F1-type ATP synthase membrane subunit b/b'